MVVRSVHAMLIPYISCEQIVSYVDGWLRVNKPEVRRWQYDDNSGERSILLFHVHVFIETIPFSFTAKPSEEYFPPHMQQFLTPLTD